jgi:hypothetical protein
MIYKGISQVVRQKRSKAFLDFCGATLSLRASLDDNIVVHRLVAA